MPYPLPEIIVNGVTAGHNTHAIDLNRDWNKRYQVEFYVGPPAAGVAAGKDKTAVQAAINEALAAPSGGIVRFGPGTYDVSDLAIVLPAFGSGPSIHLQGAAQLSTVLKFSTDRGAGTYAIAIGGTESNLYFHTINSIRVIGPGAMPATKGAQLNNITGGGTTGMNGVQVGSRMALRFGQCGGFRSGLVMMGNHTELRSWNAIENYYGLLFANGYGNAGDVVIDACDLTGNNMASIAVTPTSVGSFKMWGGHLGFGPYAIYFETGRTGASGLALGGVLFNQTSWEQIGNSFVYDPSQMARCQSITFVQTGNYARGFAAYGIPTVTNNPGFYVRDWEHINFIDGFPLGVTDGALFDVTGILSMSTNVWKQSYDASFTAAKSWILFGGVGSTPQVDLRERANWRAIAAQNDTTAAITAGMVLEHGGATNGFRPWRQFAGANTGVLAGVALNAAAATADRNLVVCVKQSYSVPVSVDTASNPAYQIVGSTSTIGKATGVVYDGTTTSLGGRPLIGQSTFGAIPTGGGQVNCKIDIP